MSTAKKSVWSEKLDEAGLTSTTSRIDAIEQNVTKLLSVLTLQSEQLSRQENIINDLSINDSRASIQWS